MLVPLHLPVQDVLAGLETSFFSGAESDIRDCGLWFGGTGETLGHIEPLWRVDTTSFPFPGRACWA